MSLSSYRLVHLFIASCCVALVASAIDSSYARAHEPESLAAPVCCRGPVDEDTYGRVNHGSVTVGTTRRTPPRRPDPESGASGSVDPAAVALVAACLDTRAEAVAQQVPVPARIEALCGATPTPTPAVTQALVLRAFRELPLYRGLIHTDPRGWTLVNLDTYFWCADAAGRTCAEVGGAEQSVTLLGRQVRVRPRIVSYTWSYGDGTEETVTGAGRVAHVYRSRATAAVGVTLTWTADFAVAGQPFQPIAGTTTTTSPPLPLVVRAARPVLVGGD